MTSSLALLQTRDIKRGTIFRPSVGNFYIAEGTAYPGAPTPPSCIYPDGSGYWCGFSSAIIGGLMNVKDGLWQQKMIGYRAATVPMWASVLEGANLLANQIARDEAEYRATHGGSLDGFVANLSGYSQGAMVVMYWFLNYVLKTGGAQQHLLKYIYRIYLFGDPMRAPGIAHGNALLGNSESIIDSGYETAGIAGNLCYTAEVANMKAPDGHFLIYSFARKGDIYACAPMGLNPWTAPAQPGMVGNLIFRMIMTPGVKNVVSIAKSLFVPVGMVQEIFNGMKFAAAGTNAPHWQYFPEMQAAVEDARQLGEELLAA